LGWKARTAFQTPFHGHQDIPNGSVILSEARSAKSKDLHFAFAVALAVAFAVALAVAFAVASAVAFAVASAVAFAVASAVAFAVASAVAFAVASAVAFASEVERGFSPAFKPLATASAPYCRRLERRRSRSDSVARSEGTSTTTDGKTLSSPLNPQRQQNKRNTRQKSCRFTSSNLLDLNQHQKRPRHSGPFPLESRF
jgi:hypothetical protein